jgi:chemotaxis family two-component system response regulator Rcp1
MTDRSHRVEILMVEDNPGDARLTQETLRDARVRTQMHVVKDGDEALAYLRKQAPYAQTTRPDLVLLDLNLPKKNGLEVLAEIKTDDDLKRIPVVILTISAAEQDVARSYDLYANAYIVKPVGLDQFITVVKSIEEFWIDIVKLPPGDER